MRALFKVIFAAAFAVSAAAPAGSATMAELHEKAKREGKVTILGPTHIHVRDALTQGFKAAYPGIDVEYSGMQGRGIGAKMKSEARAGIFSTDIVISGTTTGLLLLKPAKLIQKVQPFLMDDVLNPSIWRDGKIKWGDKDGTMVVMLTSAFPTVAINTNLVKPGEVSSDKDLLDPKWKGKIVTHNPLVPGPGHVIWRRLLEANGEDYLQKLVAQDILTVRSFRQVIDFIAKGRYAIAIAPSTAEVANFRRKGVTHVKALGSNDWKEALNLTTASGALMLPAKMAHPAAAQLFANWLLSKDGQTRLTRTMGYESRRLDVPTDHLAPSVRLIDGKGYVHSYDEPYIMHPNGKKARQTFAKLGFRK